MTGEIPAMVLVAWGGLAALSVFFYGRYEKKTKREDAYSNKNFILVALLWPLFWPVVLLYHTLPMAKSLLVGRKGSFKEVFKP